VVFTILTFLFVLTVLVFVHESGHYLAARHAGVRVQRFSIGFPPRLYGKKIGETEYLFSWIPLGGYVKLEGQNIDDENPRDPRNYASKTVLQRFYILVAGPVANLILALLIMPLVFMIGVDTPTYRLGPADIVGSQANSVAERAGRLRGDRLVAVGEKETPSWSDVFREVTRQALLADSITLYAQRGGRTTSVVVPSAPITEGKAIGWQPLIEPVVGFVAPDSPASAAGLAPGDRILAVAGGRISRWDHIRTAIQRTEGGEIVLQVERGGETVLVRVTPGFDEERGSWIIGISPGTSTQRHGVIASSRLGTARLWEITTATFVFLGRLVTGQGSMDALGGPVKIGIVVGEAARMGVANLLFLMAFISLQLGIFNLLPIPALDGGHIFMLVLELAKGSPLSARVRERAQMIGFSLLILLILLVTYNDILQLVS
jgi:regulator of sigma E protease